MNPQPLTDAPRPHRDDTRTGTARAGTHLWGLQLLVGLVCVVGCQLLTVFAVGAAMKISRGECPTVIGSEEYLAHPGAALVGSVVGAVAALAAYRTFTSGLRREVPEVSTRGALRELVVGAALGVGVTAVCFGVLVVIGVCRVQGLDWHPAVLGSLAAGIMAGVGEELLVRATLLRLLSAWAGPWWALGTTSLFFGAAHLLDDGATLSEVVTIILETGVLLGGAYLLTGRVWMAIGIHVAWSSVQGGVFGSSISGTGAVRGLVRATWNGPDLLTGGSMGMEGSLVTIVIALAAGTALLAVARRRGSL